MNMKTFKTDSKRTHRKLKTKQNKNPNLQIVGINKGEESQIHGIDQIFNTIIKVNFP